MRSISTVAAAVETSTRAREFGAVAHALLATRGNAAEAAKFAEEACFSPRVMNICKAAVTSGTTASPAWAETLTAYRLIAESFVQSLKNYSAFDAILAAGAFNVLPLRTRVVSVTSLAVAGVVGERMPIPITRFTLAGSELVEQKVGGQVTFTDELVRHASAAANDYIRTRLSLAVSKGVDTAFLETITASTGVSSVASSGMSGSAFCDNFRDALAALSLGVGSHVYAITSPDIISTISTMRNGDGPLLFPNVGVGGGTACGVTFVASDAATVVDSLVLIDAAQIAVGSGELFLDPSRESTAQLVDNPVDGVAPQVSLWQANLSAIRFTRFVAFEVSQPTGVSMITGISVTA